MRTYPWPMDDDLVERIDDVFVNRLRTLKSVDDMVELVIDSLDVNGMLKDTFIFYSSDNGYHLGM